MQIYVILKHQRVKPLKQFGKYESKLGILILLFGVPTYLA